MLAFTNRKKKMKVAAFIFILLLAPTLATEESLVLLYQERLKEGERRVAERQEEINTALKAKPDVLGSTLKIVNDKCIKLRPSPEFLRTLNLFLNELRQPEDYFTEDERSKLIAFPDARCLRTLQEVPDKIERFLKTYKALYDHAETLRRTAKHTRWFQRDWVVFTNQLCETLTTNTMNKIDLFEVYRWVSFCHKESAQLLDSLEHLKFQVGPDLASIESALAPLLSMAQTLSDFFNKRATILWEIILRTLPIDGLPERYASIDPTFFQSTANPIKRFLEEADDDIFQLRPARTPSISRTSSLSTVRPLVTPHHRAASSPLTIPSSSLSAPSVSLSAPVTPQSLRSIPYSQQSTPRLLSSTPLPSRAASSPSTPQLVSLLAEESSPPRIHLTPISTAPRLAAANAAMLDDNIVQREDLAQRLCEAFVQTDSWNLEMLNFEEKLVQITNTRYILNALSELPKYYSNFLDLYLLNLSQGYNILTPKAFLVRPGLPMVKVYQSIARKACSFKDNGPLCLNKGGDDDTVFDKKSFINDLTFIKGESLCPARVNEQLLQCWLEELFGIPTDQIVFMALENVCIHLPDAAHQRSTNSYIPSDYVYAPEGWTQTPTLNFLTVQRKQTDQTLHELLLKIAEGNGSFSQLDQESLGLTLLFSSLTKQTLMPHRLELVSKGDKFALKRAGFEPILQPLFMRTEDDKHQFLGQNICRLLLPILENTIPEGVRKSFFSNDINLILPNLLIQFRKLQKQFDELIRKYDLTKPSEIGEVVGQPITLARALGLTLAARKETVHELMRNFTIMKSISSHPGATYTQVLRAFSPLEFDCYEQILKNARKKFSTTPVFFIDIIPSLLARFRQTLEQCVLFGEQPPYSSEQLECFQSNAAKYREKIDYYFAMIDKFLAEREIHKSKIANIEYSIQRRREDSNQKSEELRLLRSKLSELEGMVQTAPPPLAQKKKEHSPFDSEPEESPAIVPKGFLENFSAYSNLLIRLGHNDIKDLAAKLETNCTLETLSAYQDQLIRYGRAEILKLDKSLEENGFKIVRKNEKITGVQEKISLNNKALETLNERLSPKSLFRELEGEIAQIAQKFFLSKYKWAEERGCFHAHLVIRALDSMGDAEKPLTYEDLVQPTEPVDWTRVPLQLLYGSGMYAQFVELNHTITDMAQDIINRADVSKETLDRAIETMDLLLDLLPQPNGYHESWNAVRQIAEAEFLALPPRVQIFFRQISLVADKERQSLSSQLGLSESKERNVLQTAQLQRCNEYDSCVAPLVGERSTTPLPAQRVPGHVYRQLWKGVLKTNEKTERMIDAILDLLLLPPYSPQVCSKDGTQDPGSIGLVSHPAGKGGIFCLHRSVGDHYLETWSEKWADFFQTPDTLPSDVRKTFISHARPILHLHWLLVLKKLCPQTQFHPWYVPTLDKISKRLQQCLSENLSISVDHVFKTLFPEIYTVFQQRFDTYKTRDDVVDHLRTDILEHLGRAPDQDNKRTFNLSPIEQALAALDYSPDGKTTILSILSQWDEMLEKTAAMRPMSLDDAAVEFLSQVNPRDYEPETLSNILLLAQHFAIDLNKINPTYWNDPQILKDLVNIGAPLDCIELAISFRVGYPITINQKAVNSYMISGTDGNTGLLCELISLFPNTVDLHIPRNRLYSLTDVLKTLQTLPNLSGLHLEDNPIHDPVHFRHLSNLRALSLSRTFIPPVSLAELRLLVSANTRVTPLPGVTDATYVNVPSEECQRIEQLLAPSGGGTDPLLKLVGALMRKGDPKEHNRIIYILERLAETRWQHVLMYGDINTDKIGENLEDYLGRLTDLLKPPCEPRRSIKNLLSALGFDLPVGTNPNTLLFQPSGSQTSSPLLPPAAISQPLPRAMALPFQPCDLTRLEVSNNRISQAFLPTLSRFINLKTLILTGTQQKILLDQLPRLPKLTFLDLSRNGLQSLLGLHTASHLIKFEKLETLILVNNEITSGNGPYYNGIVFLLELENLLTVDLARNSLTILPPLLDRDPPFLYLDISDNKIADLKGRRNIETDHRKLYIEPSKK